MASVPVLASTSAAGSDATQPVKGDVPNENVPSAEVHAFPSAERTRETGQFLELQNGWVFGTSEQKQREFFNKTYQKFVYDGQTFVLDSYDDWKEYKIDDGLYIFSHADPPKDVGETFKVLWEQEFTAEHYDPVRDRTFNEGESYAVFPEISHYEIVKKER